MTSLLTLLALALAAPAEIDNPFDSSALPADVLVMLDTTVGKDAPARAAVPGLAELARNLRDGDSIAIYAFHTRVTEVLPRTTVDATNREAVATQITAAKLTSARETDLGAALASVVAQLDADKNGGTDLVLWVSEFCHSPPVTSTYDVGGVGCRSIRGGAEIGKALSPERRALVQSYLFAANASLPHENGVLAVGGVLPTSGRLSPPDDLGTWIPTLIRELPRIRHRPSATAAVAALTLSARALGSPNADDPEIEIELAVSDPRLTLTLSAVHADGRQIASEPLVLAPTARVRVALPPFPRPFSLITRTDIVTVPLTLTAEGEVGPRELLQSFGLDGARPAMTVPLTVQVRRRYGLEATAAFGLLFAIGVAVAGGFLGVRAWLVPLQLVGSFYWRKDGGTRLEFPIGTLSEVPVGVDASGKVVICRRKDAVFVIKVVRTGWGTRTDVEIRRQGVEINSKASAPGWHTVLTGATSFLWDDYRLTWE